MVLGRPRVGAAGEELVRELLQRGHGPSSPLDPLEGLRAYPIMGPGAPSLSLRARRASAMNVSVEETGPVERRLHIEVPTTDVDAAFATYFQEVRRSAHIKGFRPGKAPREVLEKYFGDRAGGRGAAAADREHAAQGDQGPEPGRPGRAAARPARAAQARARASHTMRTSTCGPRSSFDEGARPRGHPPGAADAREGSRSRPTWTSCASARPSSWKRPAAWPRRAATSR